MSSAHGAASEAIGSSAGGPGLDQRVLLMGEGGLWEGLRKVVKPGHSITIGRSRGCDVSLRRSPGFVDHEDPTGIFHSETFRKVSRVHCELELQSDGAIRVRDLSRNGLLIGGARVIDSLLIPADEDDVTIQLGDAAVGVLRMLRRKG